MQGLPDQGECHAGIPSSEIDVRLTYVWTPRQGVYLKMALIKRVRGGCNNFCGARGDY